MIGNASVVTVRKVAARHAVIELERDAGPLAHAAGQYIEISGEGEPGKPWRMPYSIASKPNAARLEFFVSLMGPAASSYVVGARVAVADTANGVLVADAVPPNRHLVCIGTGSGVAPFVSYARHFVQGPTPRFASISLFHAAIVSDELAYDAELKALAAQHDWFQYKAVLEPRRVQDLLNDPQWLNLPLHPAHHEVFLCGHPAMVSDMSTRLNALGFALPGSPATAQGRIRTERG